MALIAQQQHNFRKMWKLYHPRKLRSNHNMSEVGAWSLGDICLIHNLSKNSGRRSTFPALGKIVKFLDDNKSQAELSYKNGRVNRPCHYIILVVKANEQIPEQGLLIDPLVMQDNLITDELQLQDPEDGVQDQDGGQDNDRGVDPSGPEEAGQTVASTANRAGDTQCQLEK